MRVFINTSEAASTDAQTALISTGSLRIYGMQDLTHLAIDTARQPGVQYADVRVANYKQQMLATEDQKVSQISDRNDVGLSIWDWDRCTLQ